MEKIKVQNVKTGKISEITKVAFDQLKKGGHAKNFDVLENAPKKEIKFNVNQEGSEDLKKENQEDNSEKIKKESSKEGEVKQSRKKSNQE